MSTKGARHATARERKRLYTDGRDDSDKPDEVPPQVSPCDVVSRHSDSTALHVLRLVWRPVDAWYCVGDPLNRSLRASRRCVLAGKDVSCRSLGGSVYPTSNLTLNAKGKLILDGDTSRMNEMRAPRAPLKHTRKDQNRQGKNELTEAQNSCRCLSAYWSLPTWRSKE